MTFSGRMEMHLRELHTDIRSMTALSLGAMYFQRGLDSIFSKAKPVGMVVSLAQRSMPSGSEASSD